MGRHKQWALLSAVIGGLCIGALTSTSPGSADEPRNAEEDADEPASESAEAPARPRTPNHLEGFDPREHEVVGDNLVSPLAAGRRAVLTLDPELQAHIEGQLQRYEVPYGSVVAMNPRNGRVLAYVSHSSANPAAPDLARDATPPTASVFKVITGAALVDAGVSPNERVCFSGGGSRLTARHLEQTDGNRCATLSEAMGGSINAVFARLADRHLDAPTLTRYAEAFGFGHALPFDVPVPASPGEVPTERLEMARTAAGFWHMHMSPLHGALIASTIANDGQMPRAGMIDRVEAPDGTILHRFEPSVYRNVIPRRTARAVNAMMQNTVRRGTARRTFHDQRGNPFLPGIEVAGKTGTLSAERPYRGYTWWVGFAPADDPQIAVAALVVNTPRWRIKASYVAREALRNYLMR